MKRKIVRNDSDEGSANEIGVSTEIEAPAPEESKALVSKDSSPFFKYISKFPDEKFRFITTQSGPLATLGSCFASLFDNMRMVISEEGIVGTCLNGSHTVMARWVLRKEEMVEGLFFPPASTQEIVLDVPDFANQLAACSKSDTMCLSLNNDANPERIIIDLNEEDVTGHLEMNLNIPEEHLEIPPLEYNNRVVLTSDDFNRKLHLKTDAKRVGFDLSNNKFSVMLKNIRGKMSFSWPLDAASDSAAAQDRIVTPQEFVLSNILNVARITKATKYVSISMPERRDAADPNSRDKPLLISYQLVIGTVSFFIAPYITMDDDNVNNLRGDCGEENVEDDDQ